jgi:arylsulfatase A-like enzyme
MYAAEVHFMDRQLGRLLEYLEERNLSQGTAVVVIADHGESLSEHGIFFSHSGLFETQLRIPFMARIPGFPSNLTAKAIVTHLDVVPTVSELFDVRLEHDLPGLSLVPLLNGSGSPELAARQNFIQESAHNNQVVHRSGRWKLIWPIMKHHPVLTPEPQLFDLQEDPDEVDNLAPERADVVKQLARPLRPWISKKPIPKGQISVSDPETLERLKALGYVQ